MTDMEEFYCKDDIECYRCGCELPKGSIIFSDGYEFICQGCYDDEEFFGG